MSDLIERLRALSRFEHSDYSVGNEAADVIEGLIEDLKYIRDQCEDHPLYLGSEATLEDIDNEGGDAATITDLAHRAAAAVLSLSANEH